MTRDAVASFKGEIGPDFGQVGFQRFRQTEQQG